MVRVDQGELTKLPGIATFSSLVSLGVVHDQQRAPYDVGWQSSGWSPTPQMWSTHWASHSHLPPNLPAVRGCGVSGATRGGVSNRSRIFATPRSGRRSMPAPSGGSGPILLIVDVAKIPGRSGSAVLVAPELVVELELLRVDAQRVRRRAGCNPGTARAPWWRSRKGVLKSETKSRSSFLALLRIRRNRWISPKNFSAFSLHLT